MGGQIYLPKGQVLKLLILVPRVSNVSSEKIFTWKELQEKILFFKHKKNLNYPKSNLRVETALLICIIHNKTV